MIFFSSRYQRMSQKRKVEAKIYFSSKVPIMKLLLLEKYTF